MQICTETVELIPTDNNLCASFEAHTQYSTINCTVRVHSSPELTSMVSRATSSSELGPLVSLCLSGAPSGVNISADPVPTVSGSSKSSFTSVVEDWEVADCCRKERRGAAGASSAWLHKRNLCGGGGVRGLEGFGGVERQGVCGWGLRDEEAGRM